MVLNTSTPVAEISDTRLIGELANRAVLGAHDILHGTLPRPAGFHRCRCSRGALDLVDLCAHRLEARVDLAEILLPCLGGLTRGPSVDASDF